MMRFVSLAVVLVASVGLVACGGGGKSKSDGSAKKGDAFTQLQAIPGEIDAELQSVTAPIDQVDAMLAQMKTLPQQLNVSEGEFSEIINTALTSQAIAIPDSVQGKQREELTAFIENFSTFRGNLFATPDRAQQMISSLAATTTRIPALATTASADAATTLVNPLASKKDKDKAKQRQEDVKRLQTEAQQAVTDAQTKVGGVPARATEATVKLIAGAGEMGVTENALRAVKKPVDDAKEGVETTVDTAREGAEDTVEHAVDASGE